MKKKKIKLCLTKQLLNMFKLWCEWGISKNLQTYGKSHEPFHWNHLKQDDIKSEDPYYEQRRKLRRCVG